jgi:hypothetical protein
MNNHWKHTEESFSSETVFCRFCKIPVKQINNSYYPTDKQFSLGGGSWVDYKCPQCGALDCKDTIDTEYEELIKTGNE